MPDTLYLSVIEASTNGILITDAQQPDNPIIYMNPAFEQITGYTSDEVLGRNCRFLQNDDTQQPELDIVRQAVREGTACTVTIRNYCKDGTLFWNELTLSPVRDDEGTLTHFIGLQKDVTRQVQAEKALQQSEERLRTLINHTHDMVCLHEADGTYLYVTPACEHLLGYTPDELIGINPYTHFHPDDLKRIREESHNLVLSGQIVNSITYRIRHKSGHYLWLETFTTPIFDDDGEVIQLVSSSRDVTDSKQAEEKVRHAQYRLQQAQKMAHIGYWEWNITTGEVILSDEFYRIFDLDPETFEPSYEAVMERIHPDDREKRQLAIDATLQQQQAYRVLVRTNHLNGEERHIYSQGEMVQDDTDGFNHLYGMVMDVTELIQTEQALRQSQQRLLSILDSSPDMIYIRDVKTQKIVFSNWDEFLGYTLQDMEDADFTQNAYHPDDLEKLSDYFTVLMSKTDTTVHTGEFQFQHKEGHWEWIQRRGLVVAWDENGKPQEILNIISIITPRKHLELKLLENEERLRALLENSEDSVFLFDLQGNYLYYNGPDRYDVKPEQVIGVNVRDFASPPVARQVEGEISQIIVTGKSHTREQSYNYQNAVVWTQEHNYPVRNEFGQIIGMGKISRNITERKNMEEDLRHSEARNRAMLDAIPDLMFRNNKEGVFLDYKPVADMPLYTPPEMFLGKSITEVLPSPIGTAMSKLIHMAIVTGKKQTYEYQLPDGDTVHEFEARIVRSGENEAMTIVRDITDAKRSLDLERERERLQIALEKEREVQVVTSRFISMISHDIRNPLTVIQSSRDLLVKYLNKVDLDDYTRIRIQGHLDKIKYHGRHLNNLMEDVLTFTKTGQVDLKPAPFDIVNRLQILVNEMEGIDEKKHKIVLNTENSCNIFYGDEKVVHRMMANLISNAMKYSPQDTSIYIDMICTPDNYILKVQDEGIGVPEKDQKKLFEVFYRASNAHSIKGTGLGLAIVKACAEAHGGNIRFESKENVGTTFIITLPNLQR